MKRSWMVFMAVFVIAALAFATPVSAWNGGWGRGHARGACFEGPGYEGVIQSIPQLGLTDEQTARIKDLREAHLKDVQPLREKMFSKRSEFRLLWLQKTPDREKIKAMQKEIGSLRDQMQEKRTNHRLSMFDILTPEQRTKVQAFGAERGFGSGRGGFCGGGPGYGPGGRLGFGPGGGQRGNW